MISINVFSEEKAWSKRLKNKDIFFKKICKAFPKKYKFLNKKVTFTLLLSNNKNIKKLNNAGIKNLDELAKLNPKTKIEGLRDEIKIKRINQAKLQIEAENKGYPIFKVIEENLILNKDIKILENKDIFGRGNKLEKVYIDDSYPKYITKNKEKLSDWII